MDGPCVEASGRSSASAGRECRHGEAVSIWPTFADAACVSSFAVRAVDATYIVVSVNGQRQSNCLKEWSSEYDRSIHCADAGDRGRFQRFESIGLLFSLTTSKLVGTLTNMKAAELLRRRITYTELAFAELVLWNLPAPLPGSTHRYKYRLAYVVEGVCVLRYDNESGEGDHRHFRGKECRYAFVDVDKLLACFQRDIERIREDSDA